MQELIEYLDKRDKKINRLKQQGKQVPSDSHEAFESEDEQVGKQFKKTILDLKRSRENSTNGEQ